MSVKVMSEVLERSEATLGARLVLLVLADFAGDEHRTAWPSVRRLSELARLSERQVQYALRRLEESGEIEQVGQSAHGTFIYRISELGGADIAPGGVQILHRGVQPTAPGGVQPIAPEPPLEPPQEVLTEPNGSAQSLVSAFVDRSRAKGADPPSRVVGQIAKETKLLLADGSPSEKILLAYDVLLDRGLHPSTLASCVQQANLSGGAKLSTQTPLQRARSWVQTAGWQYPDNALWEELGRFGLEGEQKRGLVKVALDMQEQANAP